MVSLIGRRGRVPKRWRATVLQDAGAFAMRRAGAKSSSERRASLGPCAHCPRPTRHTSALTATSPQVHYPQRQPSGEVAQGGYYQRVGGWIFPGGGGYRRAVHGSRETAARANELWCRWLAGGDVFQNGGGPPYSTTLARSSCALRCEAFFGAPSIARPARPQPTTDSPSMLPHVGLLGPRPSCAVVSRGCCQPAGEWILPKRGYWRASHGSRRNTAPPQ